DAVGWERAILYGNEDGSALCVVFAATYPERTSAIIMDTPTARGRWAPDHPWADTDEQSDAWLGQIEADFGSVAFATGSVEKLWPSRAGDPSFVEAYARLIRHAL